MPENSHLLKVAWLSYIQIEWAASAEEMRVELPQDGPDQWSSTFLAQGPVSWKTVFPRTGGWGGGGDGSGGNASDGERRGAADEAPLPHPLLTSCCAARFLTGLGPVPVHSSRVGDPWSRP